MPYIELKTNVSADAKKAENLKSELGKAIAKIPGKTEKWLMVGIECETTMFFAGSSLPCAIAEVKIYGSASSESLQNVTSEICRIVNSELDVSPDRIYVKYEFVDHWGWNGSNF